jgi:hypothetical protein
MKSLYYPDQEVTEVIHKFEQWLKNEGYELPYPGQPGEDRIQMDWVLERYADYDEKEYEQLDAWCDTLGEMWCNGPYDPTEGMETENPLQDDLSADSL